MKQLPSPSLKKLIRRLVTSDRRPGTEIATRYPIPSRSYRARVSIHQSGASSVNAVEALLSDKGKKDLEVMAGVAAQLNLRQPLEHTVMAGVTEQLEPREPVENTYLADPVHR